MSPNQLLTEQGMPYKYVVSVDSKGFSDAPDEILRALGRLSWATEKSVMDAGDPFLPPNELLMLGYFEDMKIGVRPLTLQNVHVTDKPSIMMMGNRHSVLRLQHFLWVQQQLCSFG